MKTLKSLLPFLLAVFVLAGCKTDDLEKDIDALTDRVTSLEAQVSLLNENLNALRVFADGGVTISDVQVSTTEPITYTLKLSNDETLTLTQGSVGTVSTPEITIEDNVWVINGVPTSEKAVGDNGLTPEFRINSETYNWEVNFTGEVEGWTVVEDENGNPVRATTDQSIQAGDQFFTKVEETVENGVAVLKVTLATGESYSLPIVEDLLCQIVEPSAEEGFSNGVWTIGYGETVTAAVKVKGDNYIVSAPEGWTATVEVTNEETGEGTLTVTAPAQAAVASRAAVADNTTDLVLQVNKGITWAVDKIQVEAEYIVDSYYALYESGESITIGDVVVNKETFGDAVHVTEDRTLTEASEAFGVFFVDPNVTLTYNIPNSASSRRMIVIGNSEYSRTATFKLGMRFQLNMTSDPTDVDGYFLWKNLVFDASGLNSAALIAYKNGEQDKSIVFDDCEIKPVPGRNFFELTTAGRYFNDLTVQDCLVKLPAGASSANLFFTHMSNVATTDFGSLTVHNNVFYMESGEAQNFKLFNGQNCSIKDVTLTNNTFINIKSTTTGYVYAGAVTGVSNSITAENNLIWCNNVGAHQVVFRIGNNDVTNLGGSCRNNVIYRIIPSGTFNWQLFYSGKMPVADGEQATVLDSDPFEGGTFEPSTGTFIPNSTYAIYGAQQ